MKSAFILSFRRLVKTPTFALVSILTLAICVGANLTIFTALDAILIRQLPLSHPERVVSIFNSYPGLNKEVSSASIPNYFDRRHDLRGFESISIYQEATSIIGSESNPRRVSALRISPEFFVTLGTPLAKGQTFTDEHLATTADAVAIISDEFWRSNFNADPNVLGRSFLSDGLSITIIGVLPRGFRFLSARPEFFRPISHSLVDRQPTYRHKNVCHMIARMRSDVTLAIAQAELNTFNSSQAESEPFPDIIKNSGFHSNVVGLHESHVGKVKPILVRLQGGAIFLLLIGCVNLVNLLLVRAVSEVKKSR